MAVAVGVGVEVLQPQALEGDAGVLESARAICSKMCNVGSCDGEALDSDLL
jgi:hypothetical protein